MNETVKDTVKDTGRHTIISTVVTSILASGLYLFGNDDFKAFASDVIASTGKAELIEIRTSVDTRFNEMERKQDQDQAEIKAEQRSLREAQEASDKANQEKLDLIILMLGVGG